jgi:hypothetical protein
MPGFVFLMAADDKKFAIGRYPPKVAVRGPVVGTIASDPALDNAVLDVWPNFST